MIVDRGLVPGAANGRYPIRVRTDGDFDLSALLDSMPPRGSGKIAFNGADESRPASPSEIQLLHTFETSAALRPAVADNCSELTADEAESWLAIAARWAAVASATGDLRFFNTACKQLGAVNASPVGSSPAIREHVGQVAHLVADLTADVSDRLAR